MFYFCLTLISQTYDLRSFIVQFLITGGDQTVFGGRIIFICISCSSIRTISVGHCQIYEDLVLYLMVGRHFCCHADNRIVLVQFYRNRKGRCTGAVRTCILVAVCLYIRVGTATEDDRCVGLSVLNRNLVTGNMYTAAATRP